MGNIVYRMIIFYTHSSSPSQHGWCGTCDNDLKYEKDRGKRGYCDKFESGGGTPDRPESEMTRPTFKKDWGWCRGTCDERPSLSNVLQVLRVVISGDKYRDPKKLKYPSIQLSG